MRRQCITAATSALNASCRNPAYRRRRCFGTSASHTSRSTASLYPLEGRNKRGRKQDQREEAKVNEIHDLEEEKPLVRLTSARLAYPTPKSHDSSHQHKASSPISLSIHHPSLHGGHAILGRNGSGKSLLHLALSHNNSIGGPEHSHLVDGSIIHCNDSLYQGKSRYPVSTVSFDSHYTLLNSQDNRSGGAGGGSSMSGYNALTPLGGNLSKAAEFLVVRFGLYPLLNRDVATLSTGEIRKILLVRALSTRPKLLLLDNAFDGLDVPSRIKLSELVSSMIRGFRQDILVQGVNAQNTERTQVVMSTHRAEELVDEIGVVSWLGRQGDGSQGEGLITEHRRGRSGARLMRAVHDGFAIVDSDECNHSVASSIGDEEEAEQEVLKQLHWDSQRMSTTATASKIAQQTHSQSPNAADRSTWGSAVHGAWDDPSLPSLDDIASLINTKERKRHPDIRSGTPIVQAQNLRVVKDDYTLLSDLNWTVLQGERWLIAGGNGAGKSTLSKLLTGQQSGNSNGISYNGGGSNASGIKGPLSIAVEQDDVGWVSTELHMRLARSDCLTRHVLLGINTTGTYRNDGNTDTKVKATSVDIGEAIVSWLNIDLELLSRRFSNLSQGEQKMVLIARAIASRPRLLIVDEPMQGLDWHNRRRVLGLVERLCNATDVTLIYITHHLEELLPCVSKVLHLKEGKAVYNGDLDAYDPEEV